MRAVWIGLVAVALVVGQAHTTPAATDSRLELTLGHVVHTLDGQTLVVEGWVENRSRQLVSRLVVDASGFSPAGDLAAFGSDGIPWEIAPDGRERFTILLPIRGQLVRHYVVQVSSARAPARPLTSTRRGVDLSLYRPLLLTMIRVAADLRGGVLTVRSSALGFPVMQVTVEATVLLPGIKVPRLQTLTLDVPADGVTVVVLRVEDASLISLRVVDLLLKAAWAE